VKRTGKDEPIGVVIHICMETTQGTSLYSYLYLKLTEIPCFSYLLCFLLLPNRRTGGQNRLALVGGGRWHRKGLEDEYGANNVYTCM
jgi:hypothetical protein